MYRTEATLGQARALRAWLKAELVDLEPAYRTGSVPDDDHVARIISLAEAASATHSSTLADGELRIGVAQKALNLYLKHLWCLGRISESPLCPFDAVVISRLPPSMRVPPTGRCSTKGGGRPLAGAVGARALEHRWSERMSRAASRRR